MFRFAGSMTCSETRCSPVLAMCAAACDAKNNARCVGGDSFSINLSGPALQPPAAHVKDNLDG